MIIKDGSKVAFDYILTVEGKVVDSSKGRGVLKYTHGDGSLISGLTKQMVGLKAGDEKKVEVSPEEAYGLVNPAAFQNVPLASLPPGLRPEPGMMLQGQSKTGEVVNVKISEVKEDSIVVDFNHPLAGKKLFFDVKIVSVE